MATCPKCGKPNIKRRNGERKCRRCGPLGKQYEPKQEKTNA